MFKVIISSSSSLTKKYPFSASSTSGFNLINIDESIYNKLKLLTHNLFTSSIKSNSIDSNKIEKFYIEFEKLNDILINGKDDEINYDTFYVNKYLGSLGVENTYIVKNDIINLTKKLEVEEFVK